MNAQQISALKGVRRITALTAYDYPTARLLDEAGVDLLLVGDSLGMVVLGFPDTTQVKLEHIEHHTQAVARGTSHAFLVADLPIATYDTPEQAQQSAKRLVAAGAHAVKLEGGIIHLEKIKAILELGIPMVGHLGLLPQHIHEEGGYVKKGKTDSEIAGLEADILALNEAGVCGIVLEGVVPGVAEKLTKLSAVPTIGIGSGSKTCDGEIAVISDLVGAFPWFVPNFIKPRANAAELIATVASDWMKEVQSVAAPKK